MARIDARPNQAPTGAAATAARFAGVLRADAEQRAPAIPHSALSMPQGHAPMTTTGLMPSSSPPPAMSRSEFLAWLYDKPTTTALRRRFKPVCSQARLVTGLFGHENASGLRRLTTNGRKGATLKGLNESQVHSLSRSVTRSPLAAFLWIRPRATHEEAAVHQHVGISGLTGARDPSGRRAGASHRRLLAHARQRHVLRLRRVVR